jgi:hypothetical protein
MPDTSSNGETFLSLLERDLEALAGQKEAADTAAAIKQFIGEIRNSPVAQQVLDAAIHGKELSEFTQAVIGNEESRGVITTASLIADPALFPAPSVATALSGQRGALSAFIQSISHDSVKRPQ